MDFITGFPKTSRHDSIMVVLDRFTNVVHLILVNFIISSIEVVKVINREIVRLHGVPKRIVYNRYVKFTSSLWKELFEVQ